MITIRPFTAEDIPFGMVLKEQAGWNQLPADWQRVLALDPHGGFVAEWNGQPAGTVMVALFDDVTWISMMLVDAALRGRGIGRALMAAALSYAEERGARSIRLDATPLGQPLYERLGFTADYSLVRYAGMPQSIGECIELPCVAADAAAELDREVTGANRHRLLSLLEREQPLRGVVEAGTVRGFVTARTRSRVVQIGPCLGDETAGRRLLAFSFQRYAGQQVIVDIPANHFASAEIAVRHGLSPQRTLLRMTRGDAVAERLEQLWASFGPEKG